MPGPWDSELKKMVGVIPQDIVSWLLSGALFVQEASSHLKNRNIDADMIYHVSVNDRPYMLHIEFQQNPDANMAERVWEYNVLASVEHNVPVHSFLVYLNKGTHKTFIESPLIRLSAFGEEIHYFSFKVVKMWEIPTEALLYSGHKGLLPLVPLTREGLQHEAMEQAITQLVPKGEPPYKDLLVSLYGLGSLAYNEGIDLIWLQRRFALVENILKDSWLYKELEQKLQEGIQQGVQQGMQQAVQQGMQQGMQQNIVTIVQNRFASLTQLAQERVVLLKTPEQLQYLLLQVVNAHNEQEVRRYLLEAEDEQKR